MRSRCAAGPSSRNEFSRSWARPDGGRGGQAWHSTCCFWFSRSHLNHEDHDPEISTGCHPSVPAPAPRCRGAAGRGDRPFVERGRQRSGPGGAAGGKGTRRPSIARGTRPAQHQQVGAWRRSSRAPPDTRSSRPSRKPDLASVGHSIQGCSSRRARPPARRVSARRPSVASSARMATRRSLSSKPRRRSPDSIAATSPARPRWARSP